MVSEEKPFNPLVDKLTEAELDEVEAVMTGRNRRHAGAGGMRLHILSSYGVEWAIEELNRRDVERDKRVDADIGKVMFAALRSRASKEQSNG